MLSAHAQRASQAAAQGLQSDALQTDSDDDSSSDDSDTMTDESVESSDSEAGGVVGEEVAADWVSHLASSEQAEVDELCTRPL